MNNIKKIIILLIILIIIMIAIICILMKLQNVDSNTQNLEESEYTQDVIEKDTIERVTVRNNYYTVKNIVEQYYSSLCDLNKTSEDVLIYDYDEVRNNFDEEILKEKEINKNKLYNFFDENYIKETGLTIKNVQEKLGNYDNLYILIEDMYVRDITITLQVYFVFGTITEKDTGVTEDFQLMLALDSNNSTFNMYTSDYVKVHNFYELSKKEEFKEEYFNIENIENRIYNKYDYKVVNDETYVKELLKSYTQSIKYNNINYSYSKLDKEYKTNKFKEISDYEKYIQENKKTITTATLKYYKDNKYENYRQYICVDRNENYYIFNETSIMNYTLILDTYTIDLPEFTEKYTVAKVQEKVGMNIEKFLEAINLKDYRYVYSKLDNTFKKNNFPTENDLYEYIRNNFEEKNTIEYLDFSQEGDICIYKTKINERKFNIVMQLGEGTEFTMSFSFE